MHRATPLTSSFRGYVAGGARSSVHSVDDQKLMQEMSGNFMRNESRQGVESPQNYGFTSVVFDADKDGQGKVTDSAESVIGFMGGNRSFPVSGPMDDRRHRLYGLEKGDTAMFRGRDDKQQFHMNKDGGHWSAPDDKTVRMALVPKSQQQQQGSQQQKKGQKPVLDDNKNSKKFVDVTGDASRMSGDNCHLMLSDGNVYVHVADDNNVYCGAERGKAGFSKVVTVVGPTSNVFGRIS